MIAKRETFLKSQIVISNSEVMILKHRCERPRLPVILLRHGEIVENVVSAMIALVTVYGDCGPVDVDDAEIIGLAVVVHVPGGFH